MRVVHVSAHWSRAAPVKAGGCVVTSRSARTTAAVPRERAPRSRANVYGQRKSRQPSGHGSRPLRPLRPRPLAAALRPPARENLISHRRGATTKGRAVRAVTVAATGGDETAPATLNQAISQARAGLREARAALLASAQEVLSVDGNAPVDLPLVRLKLELPLPPPEGMFDLKAVDVGVVQKSPSAARGDDDATYHYSTLAPADLSDALWPGGTRQQFKALTPVVEALLEGYGADFAGFLGDERDALGVWRSEALTVIASPGNATFEALVPELEAAQQRHAAGMARAGAPHAVLLVNPSPRLGSDGVGQPWERGLRATAARLLDVDWEWIYCCRPIRPFSGACSPGVVVRVFPGPWHVYRIEDGVPTARTLRTIGPARPPLDEVVASLRKSPADQTSQADAWYKDTARVDKVATIATAVVVTAYIGNTLLRLIMAFN